MTISKIAEMAGVSIATVSRVLNNKDNVSDETRERILAIIKLNDDDNRLLLSNATCKTILMCIPSLSNPFNEKVIKGVLSSAGKHGYQVFFHCISEFTEGFSNYARVFTTGTYSGIIMQSPVLNNSFLRDLEMHFPIVMCSEYAENGETPFVSVNNKAAAEKAINYLISIGKRKIALMNTSIDRLHSKFREEGYREALKKACLDIKEDRIVHISSIDYPLAVSYAYNLLTMKDRPDAIFAISDVYAAAAISVARRLKISIPEDLAVIGFDDIDIATISSPSITTIRQPAFEIGYQSCELLISRIETERSVSSLILDTELIIRESTL